MPEFFDMVQCSDCGGWYVSGDKLQHDQLHDRLQRNPPKGVYIDFETCVIRDYIEAKKRGDIVDFETRGNLLDVQV